MNKVSIILEYWGQKSFHPLLKSYINQTEKSDLYLLNTSGLNHSELTFDTGIFQRNFLKYDRSDFNTGKSLLAQLCQTEYVLFDSGKGVRGPNFVERFVKQAECIKQFCLLGNQGFHIEPNNVLRKCRQEIETHKVDILQGSFLIKRNCIPYIDFAKCLFDLHNECFNLPMFSSLACRSLSGLPAVLTCEAIRQEEKSTESQFEFPKDLSRYFNLIEKFKTIGLKPVRTPINEQDNSGKTE